jgi:tryptophanyl-tRNA synthetase
MPDVKLEEIRQDCISGKLLCGEHKMCLIPKVKNFLADFQAKREKAKDVVNDFLYDPKREVVL